MPRSRLLFTAARGPGHPLGRTGVAQRPGAFTPAGRHAAWSVSWRRRHRSAEFLERRRGLRPPGGTSGRSRHCIRRGPVSSLAVGAATRTVASNTLIPSAATTTGLSSSSATSGRLSASGQPAAAVLRVPPHQPLRCRGSRRAVRRRARPDQLLCIGVSQWKDSEGLVAEEIRSLSCPPRRTSERRMKHLRRCEPRWGRRSGPLPARRAQLRRHRGAPPIAS